MWWIICIIIYTGDYTEKLENTVNILPPMLPQRQIYQLIVPITTSYDGNLNNIPYLHRLASFGCLILYHYYHCQ